MTESSQRYQSAFGIEPDPWVAQSYATLLILFAGIVTALSTHTAAPDSTAIRGALATVENMDTNLGSFPFDFDANGEAIYSACGADRQRRYAQVVRVKKTDQDDYCPVDTHSVSHDCGVSVKG